MTTPTTSDEPRPRRRVVRQGMRAMTAWKAALAAIAVFSLLASGSFVKAARGQEDSWHRTVTLDVANGIDRVSNFLSLNRPLDWANSALGREDTEPVIKFPPTSLPLAPGSTTTTIPPRIPTPLDPLRVRVFGDSQGYNIGYVLQEETAANPLITATFDAKVSSGLARPDFYNWPARLQESLVRDDADVVVIMVGANDDQNLMAVNGERVAVEGTPEWEDEYRVRVAGIMDILNNQRRKIVWIGEPLVARPKLNATLQVINRIVTEEAALRPWVSWVETSQLLAGPQGQYVDYLTLPGKPAIRCRLSDGVHLTFDCVDIVVEKVIAAIEGSYPTLAPTTTTLPPPETVPPETVPPGPAPPASVPPASTTTSSTPAGGG